MDILIMIAQLLLALSILVGLHELGHLLTAKFFGMRVEKFFIGFPPKIFSLKFGRTEYGLGTIPLGGFVKISGMVDESFDTKFNTLPPQPWEFRAKPAWQRLIVMLGGIIVNVITGIIIFICLMYFRKETYYETQEINKHGIYATKLAKEIGLQTGDKIIKINGQTFENFSKAQDLKYLLEDNAYYTIVRDESEVNIPIPANFIDRLSEENTSSSFIEILFPFKVKNIIPGSSAEKAGLKEGDSIIAINGEKIPYFQHLKENLKNNKGKQIELIVLREDSLIQIPAKVTEDGTLGFSATFLLKESFKEYSFREAIVSGTDRAFEIIIVQIKAFRKMFKGDILVHKSLSGPIGIAQIFGTNWDWIRFWSLCGLLSMILAFMNLLPIPALDGGHVAFLLYEIISGRAPPVKFLEIAQKIGIALLLCIMVFAFANDIYKFFF